MPEPEAVVWDLALWSPETPPQGVPVSAKKKSLRHMWAEFAELPRLPRYSMLSFGDDCLAQEGTFFSQPLALVRTIRLNIELGGHGGCPVSCCLPRDFFFADTGLEVRVSSQTLLSATLPRVVHGVVSSAE